MVQVEEAVLGVLEQLEQVQRVETVVMQGTPERQAEEEVAVRRRL